MNAVDGMKALAAALDGAGVEYMVVGSLSVAAYGVTRATKDADFVVQFASSGIDEVKALLGGDFLLDPQMSFETITCTMRYRIHHVSGFLMELFLLSEDAHDKARFARRRESTFGGQRVFIATPEDVIVTKLRWSRQGQRAKDIEDVKSLLGVRGDAFDWAYIENWCDQHGTRELLDKVRSETPRV